MNRAKKRKNVEEREHFWKNKFNSEAIELDESDEDDVNKIFKKVEKNNVSADMICLWEQQKMVLQTNSLGGYRWHPNYVITSILRCRIRTYIKVSFLLELHVLEHALKSLCDLETETSNLCLEYVQVNFPFGWLFVVSVVLI